MFLFFPIRVGSVPFGNVGVFSHFDFELSLELSNLFFFSKSTLLGMSSILYIGRAVLNSRTNSSKLSMFS